MKIYIVKTPINCRPGQFTEGQRTLAVGIEVEALKSAKEYRIYIGNNRKEYHDVTFDEAKALYKKYGDNAMTMRGSKRVFVLPLFALRYGQSKWDQEKHEKKENQRASINQYKLF